MKKSLRPGMKVRCPWCRETGIAATRGGLIAHGSPWCTGTGRLVSMLPGGEIVAAKR